MSVKVIGYGTVFAQTSAVEIIGDMDRKHGRCAGVVHFDLHCWLFPDDLAIGGNGEKRL